jgi:hypothetical protein
LRDPDHDHDRELDPEPDLGRDPNPGGEVVVG